MQVLQARTSRRRPRVQAVLLLLASVSCREPGFLVLPEASEGRAFAFVEVGPTGILGASSPISASAGAITIESSGLANSKFLIHAFELNDFGPLNQLAATLGLDGTKLIYEQKVAPGEACAQTYPVAREVYELDGTVFDALEDVNPMSVPALSAPWLADVCRPIEASAPGFVSSTVISSTCDACPSNDVEVLNACQIRFRTLLNVCSNMRETITLTRDWRGDVCVSDSSSCEKVDGQTLRCGLLDSRCELGFGFEPFAESDRFAVSDVIVERSLPLSASEAWTTGILSVPGHMVVASASFNRDTRRCLTSDGSKLLFFGTESGLLEREVSLPECVVSIERGRTSGSIIVVTSDDPSVVQVIELDLLGLELGRKSIDARMPLGLSANSEVTVSSAKWWSAENAFVLALSEGQEDSRPVAIASMTAVTTSAAVDFSPIFRAPAGGIRMQLLEAGPDGPGLYLVSGGNWARLLSATAPVLFRSHGGITSRSPTPFDFGLLPTGQAWISGRAGQTAAIILFDLDAMTLALFSEQPGDAKTVVPWTGNQALGIVASGEGTSAVRFDPAAWRFIPGTLRLSEVGEDTKSEFGDTMVAEDGSVWISYLDGRVRRVRPP